MDGRQRLIVVTGALLLIGLGAGALGSAVTDTPEAQAAANAPGTAVHPFLEDTVAFTASPGAWALLLGQDRDAWRGNVSVRPTKAHAMTVLNRPCRSEESRVIAVAVPDSIPGASRDVVRDDGDGTEDQGVEGRIDYQGVHGPQSVIATKVDLREAPPLPACLMHLSIDAAVGAAAGGHLVPTALVGPPVTDKPLVLAPVTDKVLARYSITQYFHWSTYVLLAASAVLVALAGTKRLFFGAKKQDARTVLQTETGRKYPVLAALGTALAGVSTGAVAWSDLVPSMHLGGVTVIVLIAGVLVAVGEAVVTSADTTWQQGVGHFGRVLGTAVLALLPALILLHGATIGCGAALVWLLLLVLFAAVACFLLPITTEAMPGDRATQEQAVAASREALAATQHALTAARRALDSTQRLSSSAGAIRQAAARKLAQARELQGSAKRDLALAQQQLNTTAAEREAVQRQAQERPSNHTP